MAAAKKTAAPEIDFDNFDEEAALVDAAQTLGVKTAFGDGKFYGKFPDGTVVTVPLEVSRDLLKNAEEVLNADAEDPVEQVTALLRAVGAHDDAEKLAQSGLLASVVFASKYFQTVEKVTSTALGKYF